MSAVERLLATAKAEVGYLEKATNAQLDDKTSNAGDKNYTKYARDLDNLGVYNTKKNGYSWCDIFCDWCFIKTFGLQTAMKMTGQDMKGYGAGCTASVNYYKKIGRFFKSGPQPGDQIFFTKNGGSDYYHTGIVVKVSGGKVYTIEGNTSSAAGVIENGGMVRDKSYDLTYNKIGGYGRPDYSIVEDDDMLTQDQFEKMYTEMAAKWEDNDASQWSSESRDWATSTGLVQGSGNGNFMWQRPFTREEFVTVLYRFAKMIGKA